MISFASRERKRKAYLFEAALGFTGLWRRDDMIAAGGLLTAWICGRGQLGMVERREVWLAVSGIAHADDED